MPLSDVAQVSIGYPFRSKIETEEGGDLMVFQMRDIDAIEGLSTQRTVKLQSKGGNYDRYLLQEGDLLFQSRGSRHPVAAVDAGIRGVAAIGLHVIRPDVRRVLSGYLAWWFNHPTSQSRLTREFARGTHIPFVSKSDLAEFTVPVASMDVQKRIIEIDRFNRRARALSHELDALTQQLVDGATFSAAIKEQ